MKEDNFYFFKTFDEESAEKLVSWVDSFADRKKQILRIHINSIGGKVTALYSILSALKRSHHEIHTLASGALMSCAFILFICGDNRRVDKYTECMSHKPWTSVFFVNEDEMGDRLDNIKRVTKQLTDIYVENSGLSRKEVKKILLKKEDVYITPSEMVKYGLAEEVV